jgi:hypothetical protein
VELADLSFACVDREPQPCYLVSSPECAASLRFALNQIRVRTK